MKGVQLVPTALCITYVHLRLLPSSGYFRLLPDGFVFQQKYPGFADRVHEGLVDIFGEKGRYVYSGTTAGAS